MNHIRLFFCYEPPRRPYCAPEPDPETDQHSQTNRHVCTTKKNAWKVRRSYRNAERTRKLPDWAILSKNDHGRKTTPVERSCKLQHANRSSTDLAAMMDKKNFVWRVSRSHTEFTTSCSTLADPVTQHED